MLSYHTHQKKATPETKPVVSGNPASNNEIFSLQIQHFLIQSFLFCGPVVQSVSTPACHAGGRRFESVPGRHKKARFSACFFVILSKPPAFSKRRQGVFSVGAASVWKLRLIYFDTISRLKSLILIGKASPNGAASFVIYKERNHKTSLI